MAHSDSTSADSIPTRGWSTASAEKPAGRYAAEKLETIQSFMNFARGEELPRWPLELFLEISNVCNLKCAMCPTFSAFNRNRYASLREAERGFIDTGGMLESLHNILSHALNVHCFGYGEPTIHPEFEKFIAGVAEYEVLIDFFTNGMNMTAELADFLVEKHIHSVTFSFSGSTKEEYENVYLGGIFEQVLLGIFTLAQTKARRNSMYPIIEINSLSFEHHVAQLERFVNLMADHGANIIHLKALQAHGFIPQLRGHDSVLRPWLEGETLLHATRLAQSRGIILSSSQYQATAVASEEEWRKAKGIDESSSDLVQISRFKADARDVVIQSPEIDKGEHPPYGAEVPPEALPGMYQIRPLKSDHGPFYCFEPFKTMYIRRDGRVKPCCFANNMAPPVGDTLQQSGEAIWDGQRYTMMRESILDQKYPFAACEHCLKARIGPQAHFVHGTLDKYRSWYHSVFGAPLCPDPSPELLDLGENTVIAERYLRKHKRLSPQQPLPPLIAMAPAHPDLPAILEKVNQRVLERRDCSDLLRGHLDRVDGGKAVGWVWSPLLPGVRLTVCLYERANLIGTVVADSFRADLYDAGIHDGRYSFEFRLPDYLWHGRPLQLRAGLPGCNFFLSAQPVIATLRPIGAA
jgi:MoaA/NifB/PqqE/SkfB family radical SAM enzyme